jgi:asparagine synthase (glutamine-hydrolysing)
LAEVFDPYAAVLSHYAKAPATEELDRQLYIDLKLAISDNDLFKVTRMTEANAVTVRFPFLDPQVVDIATVLPARLKMRGRKLRTFFKAAYADLLPLEIRRKTKHGFGLPIPVWLKTDKGLNDLMHDLLLGTTGLERGLFPRHRIEHLIKEHKSDDTSFYGTILWNLMTLELWLRRHAARPNRQIVS